MMSLAYGARRSVAPGGIAGSTSAGQSGAEGVPWQGIPAHHLRRDEQPHHQGVQLPLLAPGLAGLRVRSGSYGPEFLLPNPSGGRGVYVTSWSAVTGFAAPSIHDTMLIDRLCASNRLDPNGVREAARWAAREGHAGAAAAEAAWDLEHAIRNQAARLGAHLLLALARRAGLSDPEQAARCLDRAGFLRLAALLGREGPDLAEALKATTEHCAVLGITTTQDGSAITPRAERWTRIASLMARFRSALTDEQGRGMDAALLERIIVAIDRSLAVIEPALPEIETVFADPVKLLESCASRGRLLPDWAQRMETALDGWVRVCLLWFDPETPSRRPDVLTEIAVLTRTLGNAETWSRRHQPLDPAMHFRAGLERNERLRTRELYLDFATA